MKTVIQGEISRKTKRGEIRRRKGEKEDKGSERRRRKGEKGVEEERKRKKTRIGREKRW